LACLDWAAVVTLDLVGGAAEAFLTVFFASLALLDLLAFFLQFSKFGIEFVSLVYELAHLGH
jgi:hypothetical protein